MKQNLIKLSKQGCLVACLIMAGYLSGQEKQSRTYSETFKVKPDAVVDIDVSHTDISFETWDKDEVSVEAIVELEGATAEEAKKFFEKELVEILGNSSLVEIRTSATAPFPPMPVHVPMEFVIPEIPEMEPLFLDLRIPDLPPLPEIPPMPPAPVPDFDYDAYQEDGEAYLKKWKKEFDKNFDKKYRKDLEAWSEKMAEGAEERNKHIEEWQEEHQKMREEHEGQRKELLQQREEIRQQAREQQQKAREDQQRAREDMRKIQRKMLIIHNRENEEPNVFYRSGGGEGKNIKVKKTIKIKMPKSVKLKMNIRHGEVKLAENTKNLRATLSYARLLASTIDGDKTEIVASYSPVDVLRWNLGSLQTDFSNKVTLNEVRNLQLRSNSSDVTIGHILKSVKIVQNLGELRIKSVADNFDNMDILLQNGEFFCETPASAYSVKINGTASNFTPPSFLHLTKSGDQKNAVYTGYHLNNNTSRAILINSRFSDVTLAD